MVRGVFITFAKKLLVMNIELYDRYEAELFTKLFNALFSRQCLPEKFPESEDINARWEDISPDFVQDAVKEYNGYPLATLAWSAYIGAAVAKWWDNDWSKNRLRGYQSLQGPNGFDDLDEHILQNILGYPLSSKEAEYLHSVFNFCASEAQSFLTHYHIEAGTVDAFYTFVRTLRVMYRMGAAIQLKNLGYSFCKVDLR